MLIELSLLAATLSLLLAAAFGAFCLWCFFVVETQEEIAKAAEQRLHSPPYKGTNRE